MKAPISHTGLKVKVVERGPQLYDVIFSTNGLDWFNMTDSYDSSEQAIEEARLLLRANANPAVGGAEVWSYKDDEKLIHGPDGTRGGVL